MRYSPKAIHLLPGEHGETVVGWGKSGVLEHKIKATISLKRLKIAEKLLWRAYRDAETLFRTVPSSTAYGLIFPKTGGSEPHPKTQNSSRYYLRKGYNARNFKLCTHIHGIDRNKRPLQSLGK